MSGAVSLPPFFGIRELAQSRRLTFLSVSKIFSTKRFPRNTERLLWGVSDKGECAEGLRSSKYNFTGEVVGN